MQPSWKTGPTTEPNLQHPHPQTHCPQTLPNGHAVPPNRASGEVFLCWNETMKSGGADLLKYADTNQTHKDHENSGK